jgi:radical SAM protein with 4Fe4S-binding SPASM domain
LSNTICIIPWTNFVVGPDGRVTFCCEIHQPMTVNGGVGHIERDSFESLWNAPEIVNVRAAMAAGEKPEACHACWKRESAGGMSRRLLMNASYRDYAAYQIETLPEIGADTGYKLDRPPTHFVLEMGNVCNLKCRSCVGVCSSRIAADPVHSAWSGTVRESDPIRVNGSAWYKNTDALAEMLETAAQTDVFLTLMGGEPFLIPSVWHLLTSLVERGASKRIYVGLCTNGQQNHPMLAELAPNFRGFNLSISVDAYGKVYEYMRNGASWSRLLGTMDALRAIPSVNLCVVPTLQTYNALDLVRLFRAFDEHDTRFMFNIANLPLWIAPTCLPPSVRRIAERRLQNYLDSECKPHNVDVVRTFHDALSSTNDAFDPAAFDDFMKFTNDLDASRSENIREGIPELFALLRSAGIEWTNARRHTSPTEVDTALVADEILSRVNRSVSDMDYIFPGFEQYQTGVYFSSAVQHIVEIDAVLRENGHGGLVNSRAVADVASHYGRITRALRAALPDAAVYACDIDPAAVQFCADELGALPVMMGWRPEEDALPTDLDAIVCFSLLTHTTLDHWRRSLRAWARMLRPGGVAAFTYLCERRLDLWLAGEMAHYGDYSAELKDKVVRCVAEDGFGFASLTSQYGNEPHYGVTFVTSDVVRREIEAAGLEVLALPFESPNFGQELAVLRKPGIVTSTKPAAPKVARDVSLIALYDPRGYAAENGDPGESAWMRLIEADPPRPLPTTLGFADPRVAEIREAQAELAARHGVDAFCYRYFWDQGPRWDAPLRAMLSSGRPDFPFALMLEIESSERCGVETAMRIFEDLAPALADSRYLRIENRLPIFVAHIERLAQPRATAIAWRKEAQRSGLGDLHLCAINLGSDSVPEDYGFDSFLEPPPVGDGAAGIASSLTAARAAYRTIPTVRCARDASGAEALGAYEHWLHAAIGAARKRGDDVVFLDAWNDWPNGAYLEPDERTDCAALEATRRATRGPLSGLVLVRRLRDALAGNNSADVAHTVDEIEHVMASHERSRGRLQAAIEASLEHNKQQKKGIARRVSVLSRHLPASCGQVMIDYLDGIGGSVLHTRTEPVALRNADAHLAGWAHDGATAPELVDLFIALESCDGNGDRIFRIHERLAREHVVAQNPGYPSTCGFEARLPLDDVPVGTYRIAVIHRTPDATFRDLTSVVVTRAEADCSSS